MFGKKEMRILMVGLDAAGKVRSHANDLPSISGDLSRNEEMINEEW
jgi:hypothetical protein